MSRHSHSILFKHVCIDNENKCNYINPYSIIDLYGINKSTNKHYTEYERNEKLKQYLNMCNNKNTTIKACCSKFDLTPENVAQRMYNADHSLGQSVVSYKKMIQDSLNDMNTVIRIKKKYNKNVWVDYELESNPLLWTNEHKKLDLYDVKYLVKS
jgi:hypothetical protein